MGRDEEAPQAGEDREAAYYGMFRGSAHVVLGSGLTVAGAMFCLSFTTLPYFRTLGAPAHRTSTTVAGALTLGPAIPPWAVDWARPIPNGESRHGDGGGWEPLSSVARADTRRPP